MGDDESDLEGSEDGDEKNATAPRELSNVVAKFVDGPLEQVSGMVEDQVKYWRWRRSHLLLEKAEEFGGKILELCVDVGGTITGEHGVGTEKINQMCVQFQALELSQFHAVKEAFDPHGLLNPGKAVPTLHRCAELGAMHVHNGELPFPELERF